MKSLFLENKLNFVLTLFTVIGMLVGAFCFIGNAFWANESENNAAHENIKIKAANASESIIRLESSINVLDERTREIQTRQRRMDNKLDLLLGKK